MQINSIPEYNNKQELESILIVAHDITIQKQIENEIKLTNQKITESINYAKRIQKAILPDTKYIQQYLPSSFIFYKPKVSQENFYTYTLSYRLLLLVDLAYF